MYFDYYDNYAKKKKCKIGGIDLKKKQNKGQNEKTLMKIKEKFSTKFINTIKKRWLISGTNTILLIAILVLVVILINSGVKKLELTPIDCTTSKEYTLTKESKERIKDISEEVELYFAGYDDDDPNVSLGKQYHKANEKIQVEVIDLNERQDIVSKYNLSTDETSVVIKNGERYKVLYSSELYTYDENYNTVDVAEEKITSAIINVTKEKIAKVYFLTNYSDYSINASGGMDLFVQYLEDEVLEYENLDILVKGSIPEDCSTLVIMTPKKDFDELTTNEIIKYINKGGNILWLNSSYTEVNNLPNVNKVLAMYGVNPFNAGYIFETDKDKTALGYASCIVEDVEYSDVTKSLKNVVLLNCTKINIDETKLEELNVEKQDIITSSDKSYFRTDFSKTTLEVDGEENGPFTIGAKLTKTISAEESNKENENQEDNSDNKSQNKVESRLIIFGDNNFISNAQLSAQVYPMVFLGNNKDVVLNSIAYLTDNETDITIRKNYTKESSFTATDAQKSLIVKIIFGVPIIIIIIGFVVWLKRKHRN